MPRGDRVDPNQLEPKSAAKSLHWKLIGVLLVATAYFVLSSSKFLYVYDLFLLAVLGALALNLLMGTAGVVSIGNASLMAVGAFTAIFALNLGMPFPLDLVIGMVASTWVGVILSLPALRLRGFHVAVSTLAGHFIIIYLAHEYQTTSEAGGAAGFLITPLFYSKGIAESEKYWAVLLILLVLLTIIGASRLSQGRSGRAWRTIRNHETAAAALGIPVFKYKAVAFGISSALVGLQGGLLAHLTGSVSAENYTFALAVSFIAMVVVGGLDSLGGAVIGAAIITALPMVTPAVVSAFIGSEAAALRGPSIGRFLYGVLLVSFIVGSPRGLVGLFRTAKRRLRMKSGARSELETT